MGDYSQGLAGALPGIALLLRVDGVPLVDLAWSCRALRCPPGRTWPAASSSLAPPSTCSRSTALSCWLCCLIAEWSCILAQNDKVRTRILMIPLHRPSSLRPPQGPGWLGLNFFCGWNQIHLAFYPWQVRLTHEQLAFIWPHIVFCHH